MRVRDVVHSANGNLLASHIFGEECLMPGGAASHYAKEILMSMVAQAFDRGGKRWTTTNKRREVLDQEVKDDWDKLMNAPATMTVSEKVKSLASLIKRSQRLCQILRELGDIESLETAHDNEGELRSMIEHMKSKGESVQR